jgi:purine-binding chemotaxis protein CheW
MGAGSVRTLGGRYLVFLLAEQSYAIPTSCVEEIVPIAELTHVPGGPAFLCGFLDVGGQPAAVISLRRLLGLADRRPELYTPLVILKSPSPRLALQVDRVTRVVEFGGEEFIAVGEGSTLNDCATAVIRHEGATIVVLSPERILLEQEHQRVAELADLSRQRLAALEVATP